MGRDICELCISKNIDDMKYLFPYIFGGAFLATSPLIAENSVPPVARVEHESEEEETTEMSGIPSLPETVLEEFTITASNQNKVRTSAFNATAINAADLENASRNIGDVLSKAPGMKVRYSGGEGSDMAVSMDGFTGKHVKIFIDGVPQDAAGFGINNIPVGLAERVEVYRGVVPVSLGGDAIGGAINIITKKSGGKRWWLDAAYSYGSFNTHKSHINVGNRWDNGLKLELNAFQNYSDNDYCVWAPVEDFVTGAINRRRPEKVRRFHDRYSNEAVIGKVSVTDRAWADLLQLSMTYSQMYKEIQTGVRQEIVYGDKHRRGQSFSPKLIYKKRNFIIDGLEANLNAGLTRNYTTQVDTSSYKYNWRGDREHLNSPGEQSYLHSRARNTNWNASAVMDYRPSHEHLITLSNLYAGHHRRNENLLVTPHSMDEIAKETRKDILGVSYRYSPSVPVNVTLFAKEYWQQVAGPQSTSASSDHFKRSVRSVAAMGYGGAAAWTLPIGVQVKGSYEKAYRLPTVDEMFGDEDLEQGDMGLRPESSHNINLGAGWEWASDQHNVRIEAGGVYRDTRDYIQRNILALSGGKSAATYVNYGKVRTLGYNLSGHYTLGEWISAGANFTHMNARDAMKYIAGSTPNVAYGERMPNLPYMFADGDLTLTWPGFGGKGNRLSLGYDMQYTKSFCYYASNIGGNSADYMIPDQWAHNLTLSYAIQQGRYVLSVECRNLTDARLYDNYSLQKPGRGFFGKIQLHI